MKTLLAILLLGAGCGATPADGRLVYVSIDDAFDETERAGIAAGVRYWDRAGAHLRTWGDMTYEERVQLTAGGVAELRFIPSEIRLYASMGWYDVATNRIRYDRERTRGLKPDAMATLVAHETGHSFGLQHLDGPAVMEPDGFPKPALTPADVAEFEARFGKRASAAREE